MITEFAPILCSFYLPILSKPFFLKCDPSDHQLNEKANSTKVLRVPQHKGLTSAKANAAHIQDWNLQTEVW